MRFVVTVRGEYQIVIPKELREALHISPGDQLLAEVVEAGEIRLRRRPRSYTQALKGLHKHVWQGVDALEYLDEERGGRENMK